MINEVLGVLVTIAIAVYFLIILPGKLKDKGRKNLNVEVRLVSIVGVALAIGWMFFVATTNRTEVAAERAIVGEVSGLVDECLDAGNDITVAGKVLVWDMQKDGRSRTNDKLPFSLRAGSKDKTITVFMITETRDEQVGTYSISGQPAYRQYREISVVLWPDRKAIGSYSLVSKDPPLERRVEREPEYGNPDKVTADWIRSLKRVAQ